jgi:hypothetical protein
MDADSRVDETSVVAIAEEVGLDVDRLKQDMQDPAIQAEIDGNLELAQALRITGTPGFVIGNEFVRRHRPGDHDRTDRCGKKREGGRTGCHGELGLMPELSNIGMLTAFAAGIISFLSPCVLPLVPGYVSYVAGRSTVGVTPSGAVALRLPAVVLGLCFVLGFSTVFIVLGASATALGQMLISYRYELNLVGGAIVILFGLFVTGWIRPPG